jgi:hypothetical protein
VFARPTEDVCPGIGQLPAERIPGATPAGICPVCGGGFVVDLDGRMVIHVAAPTDPEGPRAPSDAQAMNV